MTAHAAKVLCVDDEERVLAGLTINLRRSFDMHVTTSAARALEMIEKDGPFAVVVSDMRMPHMNGATFLSSVKKSAPETVRVLLTGQTDLDSAISAVNEGQIFRFLTKPCATDVLLRTLSAAVEHHRLLTAERVLLAETLAGCVKTLSDVLALANPVAFGRATRLRRRAAALATHMKLPGAWEVEMAATLSQVSCVTLPGETLARISTGEELTSNEQDLVDKMPALTEKLLRNIPRLDGVRAILAQMGEPLGAVRFDQASAAEIGARLLKVVGDADVLEQRGLTGLVAIAAMRSHADRYDRVVLRGYEELEGGIEGTSEILAVPITGVRIGCVFAEDVFMSTGALLVARGYEATDTFVERVRHYRPGTVREPVRIIVPRSHA